MTVPDSPTGVLGEVTAGRRPRRVGGRRALFVMDMDLEELARGKLHDACHWQKREDERFGRTAAQALATLLFPGAQSEAEARADFLSKAEVSRTGRTTVAIRIDGIRFNGHATDGLGEHWIWTAKPSDRPEGRIASMADLGAILAEQAPPGWPVSC